MYLTGVENGVPVTWRCELTSASLHKRWGWTEDTFKKGQKMVATVAPARREEHACLFNSAVLEDGRTIERNHNFKKDIVEVKENLFVGRQKYLDNGQPNLEGPWRTVSYGRNAPFGEGVRYVQTPAGIEASKGYDNAFDDPILRCHFVNIMNAWITAENVNEISQFEDRVDLQYGFMDLKRTVHLDMDAHPDNLEPSPAGHSIGYFDGDVLVVDTIGFTEGILNHRDGKKHSEEMHVIERFYVDYEKGYLVHEFTVEDPLYLAEPSSGYDGAELVSVGYTPYDCVELSGQNNLRPGEVFEFPEGAMPTEEMRLEAASLSNSPDPAMTVESVDEAQSSSGSKTGWILAMLGVLLAGIAILVFRKKEPKS